MAYGEHHLWAYDESVGRSREFTCEELQQARRRISPIISIAPEPFEYGEMWRREADKQKERAELAEKRLDVLMKAVEDLWEQVNKESNK